MFPQSLRSIDEYDKALIFFEGLLRERDQCRLEQEYPLVFSKDTFDQILLCERNGDPKAGLVCLPRKVELMKGMKANALFVGSVVTSPDVRRQGLQRQLFEALDELAEKQDIDFLVLWSNQVSFYEKLGFFLGGLQASWFVEHKGAFGPGPEQAKVVTSGDLELMPELFESFSKKSFRVERTFEEMKLLWKIPKMLISYTKNAYALVGKGEDFQGVCHEWAGPADEVIDCLRALSNHVQQFRILSPGVIHSPDELKVINQIEKASVDNRMEYLGLFKVISNRVHQEGFSPEALKYPFFIWGLDSI